jgi:hypothetical protein
MGSKALITLLLVMVCVLLLFRRSPRRSGLNVAVIHELMPSRFMGGNMRLRQICEWLRSRGHSVVFVFRQPLVGRFASDAIEWGRKWKIELVGDDLSLWRFRNGHWPGRWDVALLGVWFYRGGKTICDWAIPHLRRTKVKIVLVSDDVHSRRCVQELVWTKSECAERRRREELLYSSPDADALIAISEEDAAVFVSKFKARNVIWLPLLIGKANVAHCRVKGSMDHILYVGTCQEANRLAIRSILDHLTPLLKDATRLTFAGCGEWIVEAERKRADLTHLMIESVGLFQNLEDLLDTSTIMLLPAGVTGTGVSTKVRFALEYLVPVVTNRAGAVGLPSSFVQKDLLFIAANESSAALEEALTRARLCVMTGACDLHRTRLLAVVGRKASLQEWDDNVQWTSLFET